MANFQQHLTATNRFSFTRPRSGKHDDIVCSLGFGVWWAIEKRKRNRFYVWSGSRTLLEERRKTVFGPVR